MTQAQQKAAKWLLEEGFSVTLDGSDLEGRNKELAKAGFVAMVVTVDKDGQVFVDDEDEDGTLNGTGVCYSTVKQALGE